MKLKNGIRYRYQLSATDQAGKRGNASATALPRALASPAQGQKVKKPPLLRWVTVKGADYYNVQLFFRGHKVLSSWPVGPKLGFRPMEVRRPAPTRSQRAVPLVRLAGLRPPKAAHYGKLLGSGIFVVA